MVSNHVLGNGRLGNVDAKLEEFAVHARCSPERIGKANFPDEIADVFRYGGATGPAFAGLPGPEESEALAGPADNGVRFDIMSGFLQPDHSLDKQAHKKRSTGRR